MRRLWSAMFAISAATGCYYYEPLARSEPVPGSYLAATLNDWGTDTLSQTIGPDVRSIRGRVLTSDSAALNLSVTGVTLHHGEDVTWKGENVTLYRRFVAGIQERRLSRSRSALIVAASIAGLVATYEVFQGVGLIPTRSGGPPPPK